MTLGRTISLLLIVALTGCVDTNEEAASKLIENEQLGHRSAGPAYGDPQQIAAPFRFVFEESSIELCSSSVTKEAPACLYNSRKCWLVFNDNANRDMDTVTKQNFIAEEGTYWIVGVGRMVDSKREFGHSNAYDCQVEMTKVSQFVKISD